MDMNWLQSLLYGFVSGLTDFLPISSQANQSILLSLFGVTQRDPIRDFLVHLAILFSLFSGCKDLFGQLKRDNKLRIHNHRTHQNTHNTFVMRLVKTAAVPLLIGMLILSYIYKYDMNLLTVALFLLINGIVLYIPSRMIQGNKDAESMSVLDSWLIGLTGACSVFSGISRLGGTVSVAVMRGADRQKALNWALILSVPALIALSGLDLFKILFHNGEINILGNLLGYLLSAVGSCLGAYISVIFIRFLTVRMSYTWFAYYSWGASLFSLILYLTVV